MVEPVFEVVPAAVGTREGHNIIMRDLLMSHIIMRDHQMTTAALDFSLELTI